MIEQHNTCELFGRIGFDALNVDPAIPEDHDDSAEAMKRCDNQAVAHLLRSSDAQKTSWGGVRWEFPANPALSRTITWPLRMPNMVTWTGQMRLDKIINDRIAALGNAPIDDLCAYGAGLKYMSGLDARTCLTALDFGFSPQAHDMLIEQYVGAELLAIYGADVAPLISYSPRVCGVFDGRKIWRFSVSPRQPDSYYYRWNDSQTFSDSWATFRQSALV